MIDAPLLGGRSEIPAKICNVICNPTGGAQRVIAFASFVHQRIDSRSTKRAMNRAGTRMRRDAGSLCAKELVDTLRLLRNSPTSLRFSLPQSLEYPT